jgi:hypothetical protein
LPLTHTQSGPGTGGMQLLPLVGDGVGVGACAPPASGFFGDITASKRDRTHKPARRMIHLRPFDFGRMRHCYRVSSKRLMEQSTGGMQLLPLVGGGVELGLARLQLADDRAASHRARTTEPTSQPGLYHGTALGRPYIHERWSGRSRTRPVREGRHSFQQARITSALGRQPHPVLVGRARRSRWGVLRTTTTGCAFIPLADSRVTTWGTSSPSSHSESRGCSGGAVWRRRPSRAMRRHPGCAAFHVRPFTTSGAS